MRPDSPRLALLGVTSIPWAVLPGGDLPGFAAVDEVCGSAQVTSGVLLDAFDLPVQEENGR